MTHRCSVSGRSVRRSAAAPSRSVAFRLWNTGSVCEERRRKRVLVSGAFPGKRPRPEAGPGCVAPRRGGDGHAAGGSRGRAKGVRRRASHSAATSAASSIHAAALALSTGSSNLTRCAASTIASAAPSSCSAACSTT